MEDFSAIQSNITSALVSTTRGASALVSEDVSFHRSLDASLGSALDRQNARLLGLTERLLGAATADTEIVRPPRLKDLESVDGNWTAVVDVLDSLLERADTALDEFTGAVKRLSPGAEQALASKPPRLSRIAAALKSQDMEKPQLNFEHLPTNREIGPFKPLLLSKPHAMAPLETEPVVANSTGLQTRYPHPYQCEIEQYRYPTSVYTHSEPIPPTPFDTTSATLVDTEELAEEMLQELKQTKEIAIDLEHHDSRSFIGLVSLMQISTRNRDWIVDTLKPWRRKLQCLNEVFADPNIVKVLHGAYMDIVWLQRDLGLYIVGLFDTHYASRALGYAGGSLAFLLKKFVNVDAQKQYQTADWRIRPLPQELLDYARSDTHYLLYIFDCMKNELVDRSNFSLPNHEGDKLWSVLEKSTEVALQRYEHPVYDSELGQGPMGWYRMLSKTSVLFNKEQFCVFRAIHQWRDNVAREQDDSLHYVMPHHQIFSLAKAIPATRTELLSTVHPVSQTVRLRLDELVSVIIRARDEAKDGPDMMDVINAVEAKYPKQYSMQVEYRKSQIDQTSVPQTKVSSIPSITGVVSSLPLRSSTSAFWGPAFDRSNGDQKRDMSTANDISLIVPLPPLTAEIFANPTEFNTPAKDRPDPTPINPEPVPLQKIEDDDVFVLKNLSKKRRHLEEEPFDGMAMQSDRVDIPDDLNPKVQRAKEKAERRKAKKEAKRAAKAQTDQSDANPVNGSNPMNGDHGDAAPFDYASAPSILNPARDDAPRGKDRVKNDKPINPYAKSLDAPKGLPRVQKERAGKSMTYQS